MTNYLSIAIDTGKHSTKAVATTSQALQKIRFRTKVMEARDLGTEISGNSYLIEYEGKAYLIGDMVAEDKTNYDISKHSMEHLLCIYLAITRFIEKAESAKFGIPNIRLAVNVPLSIYKNNTLKREYEQFILNNQKAVSLRVNNKPYIFRIQSVLLLPEAIGPVYSRISDFRGKRALVIDIGSLNISYCLFNDLVPKLDTMIMSNLGINILRSKIAERLTSKYGIAVSDEDVEQILKDGYLYAYGVKQKDSKEIVENLISAHVSEIFNYAKSRGITFNNTNVVFCGGGSILLKESILRQYPSASIENDSQFANVLSYKKIMEAKGLV
jgi:plasmid segregation protein ParM